MVRQPLPPWLSGTAAHGCLFLPFLLVRAVFVVSLPSFLVTLSGLECSFSSYFAEQSPGRYAILFLYIFADPNVILTNIGIQPSHANLKVR